MKKSKYIDAQIMSIRKEAEGSVIVADLCRARRSTRLFVVLSDCREGLLALAQTGKELEE